jgi:hypothetical protein
MLRILSSRKAILAFTASVCILVFFVSLGSLTAQNTTSIAYGAVLTGTISETNSSQAFSFSGNAGDLVRIRVLGLTPNMDPNVTLLGVASETIANNDNDVTDLMSTSSSLVVRLPAAGSYTIVVGGTVGDFLLTLEGEAMAVANSLELDAPLELQLPFTDDAQVFSFNTDPNFATTPLI